jgi:hypothetical protein
MLSPVLLLHYFAAVLELVISVIHWLLLKPFYGKKMAHFLNLWWDFRRGLRDIF